MIDSMTYFSLKLFHTSLVISMPGNYFKTKIHYTQEKLDNALANIRNKNMIRQLRFTINPNRHCVTELLGSKNVKLAIIGIFQYFPIKKKKIF